MMEAWGMKDYEARHIFMAIAIGILALSPFLLVMLPLPLANMKYKTSMTWVVTVPQITYLFYGIGLFLLFLSFFTLFLLSLSKISKLISCASLIVSILFIAHGSQQFTALSGEAILFKETVWEGTQSYTWDEIEKVNYFENRMSGDFPIFEFYFTDGNMLRLQENRFVQPWYRPITEKLESHEVEFNRK
jgi:uncharacterized protein YacL